jgi:hypothetical protein
MNVIIFCVVGAAKMKRLAKIVWMAIAPDRMLPANRQKSQLARERKAAPKMRYQVMWAYQLWFGSKKKADCEPSSLLFLLF